MDLAETGKRGGGGGGGGGNDMEKGSKFPDGGALSNAGSDSMVS